MVERWSPKPVVVGSIPTTPANLRKVSAEVTQLVECQISNLNVAGSKPVFRTNFLASVAQMVELLICNEIVAGSNPVTGSIKG